MRSDVHTFVFIVKKKYNVRFILRNYVGFILVLAFYDCKEKIDVTDVHLWSHSTLVEKEMSKNSLCMRILIFFRNK